jgi:hypothetical protein
MNKNSTSTTPTPPNLNNTPKTNNQNNQHFDIHAHFHNNSTFINELINLPHTPKTKQHLILHQTLTKLTHNSSDDTPNPLEKLQPETLTTTIKLCLKNKLLDNLD